MSKKLVLSLCLICCVLIFVSCERKEDTGLSFGNLITGNSPGYDADDGDVVSIQQMSYISHSGLSAAGVVGAESIPDGTDIGSPRRVLPILMAAEVFLEQVFAVGVSGAVGYGAGGKIVDYFNKMAKKEVSADEDGWNEISHFEDWYYRTRITARGRKGEYFYIKNKEDLEKLVSSVQGTGYKAAITLIEIKVYLGIMDVYEVINCEVSPKKAKFILTADTRKFSSGWLTLDTEKDLLYNGTATLTDPNGLGNITGSFIVMNSGGVFNLTGAISVDQDGMVGIYGISLTGGPDGWRGNLTYNRPRYSGTFPGGGTWVSEAVHESSSIYAANWVREVALTIPYEYR